VRRSRTRLWFELHGEAPEMILIVEDNLANGELLKLFLERKAGLSCLICSDGDEIHKMCSEGKIQLVIMDIQLHNTFFQGHAVNGVELTRALKNDARTANIPVLLATAHAMREERDQFLLQSGAQGYLTKPVEDYDLLIAEVRQWIEE
jgi:two-component system, cell cycle response regulator DivK